MLEILQLLDLLFYLFILTIVIIGVVRLIQEKSGNYEYKKEQRQQVMSEKTAKSLRKRRDGSHIFLYVTALAFGGALSWMIFDNPIYGVIFMFVFFVIPFVVTGTHS